MTIDGRWARFNEDDNNVDECQRTGVCVGSYGGEGRCVIDVAKFLAWIKTRPEFKQLIEDLKA